MDEFGVTISGEIVQKWSRDAASSVSTGNWKICRSSRAGRCVTKKNCWLAKSSHCQDAKHDEDRHNHNLRDLKRRLGLRRRQRVECGHLFEELHDQYKNIQVEADHAADHVRATPSPRHLTPVP